MTKMFRGNKVGTSVAPYTTKHMTQPEYRTSDQLLSDLFQSEGFIRDIRAIAAIDNGEFDRIMSIVEQADGFLGPRRFAELFNKQVPNEQRQGLTHFVFSFDRVRKAYTDDTIDEFTAHAISSLRELDPQPFSQSELDAVIVRLPRITKPKSAIERHVAAGTIARETGALVQDLRLVCDLRPIFDAEDTESPTGIVPVITLKISATHMSGDSSQSQSLELNLNEIQLAALIGESEKIRRKLQSLQRWLDAKGISHPESSIEDGDKQ